MEINSNNYEAYLLDYFENSLSTEQVAELMVFLQAHPELNVDVDGFEMLSIQPDKGIVFDGKESLKHTDIQTFSYLNHENYEEYFVASIDGELTPEQEQELGLFISLNPHLKKEYELFSLTVLQADTTIIYKEKTSLKKSATVFSGYFSRQWVYNSLAAAASLALLVGLYFEFTVSPVEKQLAQISPDLHNSTIVLPQRDLGSSLYQLHQKAVPTQQTKSGKNSVQAKQTYSNPATLPAEEVKLLALRKIQQISMPVPAPEYLSGSARTYYTELYGYMELREQREYQEYLDNLEARPWYAKVYASMKSVAVGPEQYDPKGAHLESDIWLLAEAGIKGINYLTRSELHLRRQVDEDGRTSAYAVASNHFQYAGKVEK